MAGGPKLLSEASGNLLHSWLLEAARNEGFPLAGALDLDRAAQAIVPHVERYDAWLGAGHQGAMSYLERGRERRADPRKVFPEARSMLCVALPYGRLPAGAPNSGAGPRYARYLEGGDYHDSMPERLERAMQAVARRCEESGLVRPKWKVCVDTSAVLERSWAALAGLGWIGKNTLLIHPRLGSYLFLGEVLIDQPVEAGPKPLPDLCGHCTRCLDACPTQALLEPRWLDSRRCVSYLTLEKRGSFEASSDVLNRSGAWIAGCDVCQEVCPFNRKSVRDEELAAESSGAAAPSGAIALQSWEELLGETESQYRERVKGSALGRVKPAQFRRNIALSLANAFSEARAAEQDDLRTRLGSLVRQRASEETDGDAREQWQRLLDRMGI